MIKGHYLDIPKTSSREELEPLGTELCEAQRAVLWQIGDLARYAESRWPEHWHQVFPEWVSPGLIDRCKGVAKAYPKREDRFAMLSWSQHMHAAGKPNRRELLEKMAEECLTSDESRKMVSDDGKPRWLLAIDVNYHLHRHWYSGAGVEAASRVTEWIRRTVDRLKEKGLTDVVCAFDSSTNFRKELTEGPEWEDRRYKDRPPKEQELVNQLTLVRELLDKAGFLCVQVDGFESDDVLASYAHKFDGKVTILSQDKDLRQCLSDKCNMLLDVEWTEDPSTGEQIPDYKWLTAKQHTNATGIRPSLWSDYQTIMGDATDGVKGAEGIGEKGAADLILQFGGVEAVIKAARDEHESIKPKKREALIRLGQELDTVRQLVTLRRDVSVPSNTRIQ